MPVNILHEALMYSVYFAPRGLSRLLNLGYQLAQRHLSPTDKLIGFIGDAGAGKSVLIKGMFPGLELTNDDQGVNMRPLPLLETEENRFFSNHTYHVDIRFESAFTQMHELAGAVHRAIDKGKRVIVEHFDLLYPALGMNAEILIGIGEEVIITRPNIFGPLPEDIADIVFQSIKYRKMAHTAEDITHKILQEEFGFSHGLEHSDVKHGFVLEFSEKPEVDIEQLEHKVKEIIRQNKIVSYMDENHIRIGKSEQFHCTGPRIHVHNTGEIENYRLVKEFKYNPISKLHALVGLVGSGDTVNINDLNSFK